MSVTVALNVLISRNWNFPMFKQLNLYKIRPFKFLHFVYYQCIFKTWIDALSTLFFGVPCVSARALLCALYAKNLIMKYDQKHALIKVQIHVSLSYIKCRRLLQCSRGVFQLYWPYKETAGHPAGDRSLVQMRCIIYWFKVRGSFFLFKPMYFYRIKMIGIIETFMEIYYKIIHINLYYNYVLY